VPRKTSPERSLVSPAAQARAGCKENACKTVSTGPSPKQFALYALIYTGLFIKHESGLLQIIISVKQQKISPT